MVRLEYKKVGQLEEFNKLKPKLAAKQLALLNAFNRLSQERRLENGGPMPIKDRDIHYYQHHNGSHGYAPDLFIMAIHGVDQEYIDRRCKDMKAAIDRGK